MVYDAVEYRQFKLVADKLQKLVPQAKLSLVPAMMDPTHSPAIDDDHPFFTQPPLIFYHLFKSGGMSFYSAYMGMFRPFIKEYQYKEPMFMGRCDHADELTKTLKKRFPRFLTTHLPFGLHEHFNRECELIFCSREPVGRVKSAYGYEMMRNGWLPEKDDYQEFINDPLNRNLLTAQLAGVERQTQDSQALYETALVNLEKIDIAFPLPQMNLVMQQISTRFRLPCLISERVNPTLPEYIANYPELDDELRALNRYDDLLHQHIIQKFESYLQQNPPIKMNDDDYVNPTICVLGNKQVNDGSTAHNANLSLKGLEIVLDKFATENRQFADIYDLIYKGIQPEVAAFGSA